MSIKSSHPIIGMMTFSIFLVILSALLVHSGKINEGTNYEVDEDDIITYLSLGKSCDPEVQDNDSRKTGLCRATLHCHPETRLCDCEDLGPYKYTATEDGLCKNYAGSACYGDHNCVKNAICKGGKCQCAPGKSCQSSKINARPR